MWSGDARCCSLPPRGARHTVANRTTPELAIQQTLLNLLQETLALQRLHSVLDDNTVKALTRMLKTMEKPIEEQKALQLYKIVVGLHARVKEKVTQKLGVLNPEESARNLEEIMKHSRLSSAPAFAQSDAVSLEPTVQLEKRKTVTFNPNESRKIGSQFVVDSIWTAPRSDAAVGSHVLSSSRSSQDQTVNQNYRKLIDFLFGFVGGQRLHQALETSNWDRVYEQLGPACGYKEFVAAINSETQLGCVRLPLRDQVLNPMSQATTRLSQITEVGADEQHIDIVDSAVIVGVGADVGCHSLQMEVENSRRESYAPPAEPGKPLVTTSRISMGQTREASQGVRNGDSGNEKDAGSEAESSDEKLDRFEKAIQNQGSGATKSQDTPWYVKFEENMLKRQEKPENKQFFVNVAEEKTPKAQQTKMLELRKRQEERVALLKEKHMKREQERHVQNYLEGQHSSVERIVPEQLLLSRPDESDSPRLHEMIQRAVAEEKTQKLDETEAVSHQDKLKLQFSNYWVKPVQGNPFAQQKQEGGAPEQRQPLKSAGAPVPKQPPAKKTQGKEQKSNANVDLYKQLYDDTFVEDELEQEIESQIRVSKRRHSRLKRFDDVSDVD